MSTAKRSNDRFDPARRRNQQDARANTDQTDRAADRRVTCRSRSYGMVRTSLRGGRIGVSKRFPGDRHAPHRLLVPWSPAAETPAALASGPWWSAADWAMMPSSLARAERWSCCRCRTRRRHPFWATVAAHPGRNRRVCPRWARSGRDRGNPGPGAAEHPPLARWNFAAPRGSGARGSRSPGTLRHLRPVTPATRRHGHLLATPQRRLHCAGPHWRASATRLPAQPVR